MSNPFQIPAAGLVGVDGVPLPATPRKKPNVVSPKDYQGRIPATAGTQTPAQYAGSQKQGPPAPSGAAQTRMSLYDWQQLAPGSGGSGKESAFNPNGFGTPGMSPDAYDGRGLTDVYGRGLYGNRATPIAPRSNDKGNGGGGGNGGGSGGGRGDTRVIPGSGGQTQTGTNMGKINMPGLEDADLSGIANFNGPSFPTQPETNRISDGYANTSGVSGNDEAILYAQSRGGLDGFTGSTTDEALLYAQSRGGLDGFKPGGKFSGAPTATDGQDAPTGGGMQAALADRASLRFKAPEKTEDPNKSGVYDDFGGSNPAMYAQSGEEMRRRAAFLDEPDSMKAMQNVAAGMGMGNQGLRNFANVDGKAVEMSSADRRAILQAAPGEAQALKDKWVKALATSKQEEPQLASSAQNPNVESGTSNFITNPNVPVPSASADADYRANNQEDNLNIAISGNDTKKNAANYQSTAGNFGKFDAQKFYLK